MNDFVNQIGLLEDVLGNRRSVQALSMYMLMVVLYRLSPDFRDPDRDPIDALPKDLDLLWRDLSEEGVGICCKCLLLLFELFLHFLLHFFLFSGVHSIASSHTPGFSFQVRSHSRPYLLFSLLFLV